MASNDNELFGGGDPGGGSGGRSTMIGFVVGLVVGVVLGLFAPALLGPRLPAMVGGRGEPVVGTVLAEQREDDRLLLTVETEQGAILATFRERQLEIDLLVDAGDRVTLRLRAYSPFVEDPTISAVNKAGRAGTAPGADQTAEPASTEAEPTSPASESEAGAATGSQPPADTTASH